MTTEITDINSFMESLQNEGVTTKSIPLPEGWYPAFINDFRFIYYVVDKNLNFLKT